ncbi:hypothetical protein DFQ28_004051 [Apophysomyces sp. BC1034]|nr:hypothetical protein DFQ30_004030 [Apophysomyces sp. BC1015]KAG0178642.1 hypothetical protein DFQ29_003210 [Apophysomyces sp. BC1021]KAG0188973.1 hypothetical protein DFQ28_004051 [Apophysomyces sp. BC1034]
MKSFREACLYGIPDEPGLRATAWKVLLGYLPPDKRMWHAVLLKQRLSYYNWVNDLLDEPGGEPPSSDHPLNVAPGSKWAIYFHDNAILDQIDKDVRRTLPDFAFFQLHVPYNVQNPLSPPPPITPEREPEDKAEHGEPLGLNHEVNNRRFSFGLMGRPRSASAASKKSLKAASNANRSRSNSKSSVRSFSSGNFADNPDKISSPRSIVRKLSSAFKSSPPVLPKTKKSMDHAHQKPICPHITSRRSLFKRIAHLNNEFGLRDGTDADRADPKRIGDYRIPDYHWEAIERILFIYAKLNPGVGYVQGMNELLAPIYYLFAKDGQTEAQAHAEADAFFVFTTLMSDVRDHFVRSLDQDASTGIHATLLRMSQRLKWIDRALWRDLNRKDIKEQYYAFRWVTVLCSQEWDLPDVIRLWDSILADRGMQHGVDEPRFEFLLDFAVAMIICVRSDILKGDFADNMRLLQNYPIDDIHIVLNKAYSIRDMRLQAIAMGRMIPGDQRNSGLFGSDWSDTSSISSTGSGSRLQRLRDTTDIARASFDSFRRESKESIDELFKKGLGIHRSDSATDHWKRASTGDVSRNLSLKVGFNNLASKVRRSGSVGGTLLSQRNNSQTTSEPDRGMDRLSWMRNMSRSNSITSTTSDPARSSSLLNRFSQIMVNSNTSVSPYRRDKTQDDDEQDEDEDEKHIFAKASSARDDVLNRNAQMYRGFV